MGDFDAGETQRYIDLSSNFCARVADSDDIGGRVFKRVERWFAGQAIVEIQAQHRKRRSGVHQCIANLNSVDRRFGEDLRSTGSC